MYVYERLQARIEGTEMVKESLFPLPGSKLLRAIAKMRNLKAIHSPRMQAARQRGWRARQLRGRSLDDMAPQALQELAARPDRALGHIAVLRSRGVDWNPGDWNLVQGKADALAMAREAARKGGAKKARELGERAQEQALAAVPDLSEKKVQLQAAQDLLAAHPAPQPQQGRRRRGGNNQQQQQDDHLTSIAKKLRDAINKAENTAAKQRRIAGRAGLEQYMAEAMAEAEKRRRLPWRLGRKVTPRFLRRLEEGNL